MRQICTLVYGGRGDRAAGFHVGPMTIPTPDLHALGVVIRVARADLEISQEELADRAGLHPTHISHIERGRKNVQFDTLVRLAAALGMTLADLAHAYEARALSARS